MPAGVKLLIVSAMPHHLRDGRVVGWGPTVRELDHLATRFEAVRHIACLHDGPAPDSDLPYTASNIELVPVPPAGGERLVDKLGVLGRTPQYVRTILRELPAADIVHVRAPANIALVATIVLTLRRAPHGRWFKYAGNWRPERVESLGYTLQRFWLSRDWHRGIVTINGSWPGQPPWVWTFYNPSLDSSDLADGRAAAASKTLGSTIQLVYVGRVEASKGAGRAIEIVRRLQARGVDAQLDIVGDGAEREHYERQAATAGLAGRIRFLGWLSHARLREHYRRAHVSLLPTASEGWPKVLSEGMAYGVVPVAGAVSSIPQYLGELQVGAAIPADQIDRYVDQIAGYVADPSAWQRESARAVQAAHLFSFEHYLAAVDKMLREMQNGG